MGIAHTYMAQKAIQDECAARGIECKVEAQGGLGIENELTQEDVDSADLVLESVDVGVENESVLSTDGRGQVPQGRYFRRDRRSGQDHRPGC